MILTRCSLALFILSCGACVSIARAETVLITGANSGIGLEFAKEYAARGWAVIATHRRAEVPQSLVGLAKQFPKVRIEQLDVTSLEQARSLATKLDKVPIDILVNNAGVYNDRGGCAPEDESCPGDWNTQRFGNLRYPLFDTIMAVNVKGPLIVSEAFFKNVQASALKKIVAVSSSNGSLTGPVGPPAGAIFYRSSKAALNRSMQLVAQAVKDQGVTVIMLNPGPTLTERQSYLKKVPGMLTMQFTVEGMVRTIDKATLQDTGKFFRYDGAPEAW